MTATYNLIFSESYRRDISQNFLAGVNALYAKTIIYFAKTIENFSPHEALLKEKLILSLFHQGERIGFEYIFKFYYKELVFFANSTIKNYAFDVTGEDIVQDTFIKLRESVKEEGTHFDALNQIRSFLYKTVKNACYDLYRSRKIHDYHHESISQVLPESISPSDFDEMDYNQMYAMLISERYREISDLYRIMRHVLPPKCKEVFLALLEGKSSREIADAFNISEQTVRNQKTKAIKLLRDYLKKYCFRDQKSLL